MCSLFILRSKRLFFLLRRLANCSYERLTLCADREQFLPRVGLFIAGHNLKLFTEMVLFWRVVCRLLKSGTWKQDAQSLNFHMLTVTMQSLAWVLTPQKEGNVLKTKILVSVIYQVLCSTFSFKCRAAHFKTTAWSWWRVAAAFDYLIFKL